MTHIWGEIKWWDGIFSSFELKNGQLLLHLENSGFRIMNDWDEDTQLTLKKLKTLKQGDLIKVGTWNEYSEEKWFCDVEKIV